MEQLEEIQLALGDRFKEFFPDGIEGIIEKETFQSKTFIEAGYYTMLDTYGLGDRFLYTIQHQDGTITVIMAGKVTSKNPFEVGHAAGNGLDLRKELTIVYQFNGNDTITETILSSGDVNTYEGEFGKPDVLLANLRPCLGTRVEG